MDVPTTVLPPDATKTDETDLVGNGEFLLAVFGGELRGAAPMLVSFDGNPTNVPGKVWSGWPWQGTLDVSTSLRASANNFFSLAVFRPDDAGKFRRLKTRFQALHAVMLDDLGTKIAMERLTLPPSWLLETSEGNYQAGYLLDERLNDGSTTSKILMEYTLWGVHLGVYLRVQLLKALLFNKIGAESGRGLGPGIKRASVYRVQLQKIFLIALQ